MLRTTLILRLPPISVAPSVTHPRGTFDTDILIVDDESSGVVLASA